MGACVRRYRGHDIFSGQFSAQKYLSLELEAFMMSSGGGTVQGLLEREVNAKQRYFSHPVLP